MYQINKKIINLVGLIPFMRFPLRLFYSWALKKVNELTGLIPEIQEILLVSKLDHKNFIYGSSDLNLVFIVNDNDHPKRILGQIRTHIKTLWPANILVNQQEIPVLKKSELNTPLVRSFLMRKHFGEQVQWKSLLNNKKYSFNLKPQDHFSIQFQYIDQIERRVLNPFQNLITTRHSIRSHTKHIYTSVRGLKKYNLLKKPLSHFWSQSGQKILNFSLFRQSLYDKFKNASVNQINGLIPDEKQGEAHLDNFSEALLEQLKKINQIDYVHDIILIPALIQLKSSEVKGRLYIDITLKADQVISRNQLEALKDFILDTKRSSKEKNLKLIFNILTYEVLKLKNEYHFSHTPISSLYRRQQAKSFNSFRYIYPINKKQMERASIHFLLSQFMNFRSSEQEEKLLGSKFIKSLNIIYQYKLLLEYLEGKEFALSHNFKSIMEGLTTQLSHLKPYDPVTEEDWIIIRSQMLFLLKRIRDELSKKYSSLKNLQF